MRKNIFNPNHQILLISLLVLIVLPRFVLADVGPKPSVNIEFRYNGNRITDENFYAKMLRCGKDERYSPNDDIIPQLNICLYDSMRDCYWKPDDLAWGGNCESSECKFRYRPPSEFKLVVYIPSLDQTFITKSISRTNFKSSYKVLLKSDGSAKIHETTSFFNQDDNSSSFIIALLLTLFIEFFVAIFYIPYAKLPRKAIFSVILGSMISLPFVWFVFPMIINGYILVILLSEIFAFLFEAYFIYLLNKRRMSLGDSILLSLTINIFSFFMGGIMYIFIQFLI